MSAKETRQSIAAELRAVDTQARTVDIVASTFDIDSYGTRIDPNGWDLKRFLANPVICLQHDDRGYTDSNGLPIANAIPETVRIENGKLVMKIMFPPEGDFEVADVVWNLVSKGFMKGVSVGFNPDEEEVVEESDGEGYKHSVTIYRKQELLEVSLVTIPSNDKALVQRARKAKVDATAVRSMAERAEQFLDEHDDEKKASEEMKQYKPSHVMKCITYFEKKQPVNREATKVMEKFFKRILKEEAPADEAAAWKRFGEGVEALEEKTEDTKKEEEKPDESEIDTVVLTKEEEAALALETPAAEVVVEQKEEPIQAPKPNPVESEAPAPAQKASVQIPLTVLLELPKKMRDLYTDAAIEALLRGIPVKDAIGMIDGMNDAVCNSISPTIYGQKGDSAS